MTRKRLLLGAAVLAVIIAAPIAWYLISPLFITRTVDEDFPAAQAAMQNSMSVSKSDDAMMAATPEAMNDTSNDAMMAATPEAMNDTPADAMNEKPAEAMSQQPADAMMAATPEAMDDTSDDAMTAMPAAPAEPKLLRSGAFHPVTHEGEGTASIYELPDGKRVLRLENFEVLNGPDLYVWLSSAADANNARTILDSHYAELGRLKGNKGNQNYELPPDLDVSAYNSVTIWCRRFSVNFATAPLK